MFRYQPVRAENLPLFAQCNIPAFDQGSRRSSRSVLSTVVVIGLPLALACGLLTLSRPDKAQDRPAAPGSGDTHASAVVQSATRDDSVAEKPGEDRRPLSFYTREVRTNLFSAPQPPPPKPLPPPKVEKPKPAPVVPVMPINPFADWSYTGTVKTDKETMALIENTKTKEGQYVKVGDTFQGAQVVGVTDQMVTLTLGGKPSMLAKSDNIVLTPLDKSAGPAQGNNNPGQPQPNMAPGVPPQVDMSQGTVVLPNGRVLTADQAARRARRMNRWFNGGGGGGGRFGGGGGNNGG